MWIREQGYVERWFQNIELNHKSVLILSLLVSNLILVYILVVDSPSYVDKLAHVSQSSVLKRRNVLSFK